MTSMPLLPMLERKLVIGWPFCKFASGWTPPTSVGSTALIADLALR
jgi:hypothetical protein